ncbi:MAG: hypothetical protein SFZ23_04580 [Planctomycetota bacterium]|nr:hypothetical protein [Planctomycetota bacterium]
MANAQVSQSYDNWRDPVVGGQTRLTETLRIGGDEVADDCILQNWSPGFVNDIGWTIANMSETNTLTVFRATFRFYDDSGALVGTDTSLYFLPLQPQRAGLIFSTSGLLRPLNIPTTERMFISIQFSDAVGFDVADFGLLYGGPITRGSSSSFITNRTTGQQIDLGTGNNLGFFIDTVPIPAPGVPAAAVLLAIAGGSRRRR